MVVDVPIPGVVPDLKRLLYLQLAYDSMIRRAPCEDHMAKCGVLQHCLHPCRHPLRVKAHLVGFSELEVETHERLDNLFSLQDEAVVGNDLSRVRAWQHRADLELLRHGVALCFCRRTTKLTCPARVGELRTPRT